MIKKIHQLSKDTKLDDFKLKSQELLKKYNPDYEYKLWTDEELEKIIHHHSELQKKWNDLVGIHKADLGRYLVLYLEGGYYCDTDFFVNDSFDNLPISNDIYFAPSTKDFIFMKNGITNYFIYTPPNNNFFILLIDEALKRINKYNTDSVTYISSTSGKIMIESTIMKNNIKLNSFSTKHIINKVCDHTDTHTDQIFAYHDGSTSRINYSDSWIKNTNLEVIRTECYLRKNLYIKGNICQLPIVIIGIVIVILLLFLIKLFKVYK